MAKTFHLEIVTPDGPTFKGEVESLVLPAWEGQLGVLPGHEQEVQEFACDRVLVQQGGQWVVVPRPDPA